MAVIPSGTSEPWFWAAREAAANDALARLFYQLEDKADERAFRKGENDLNRQDTNRRFEENQKLTREGWDRQDQRAGETRTWQEQREERRYQEQRERDERLYPEGVGGRGRGRQAADIDTNVITPATEAAWRESEKAHGLPAGYLNGLYGVENSGGRNLGSPGGSIRGHFQFTDATLKAMGGSPEDRNDPVKMGEYAARYAAYNREVLKKKGIELTDAPGDMGKYYIMHQQGEGGGAEILTNPKGKLFENPTHRKYPGNASNNGGKYGMTNERFVNMWADRMQPWYNSWNVRTEGGTKVAGAPSGTTTDSPSRTVEAPAYGLRRGASDYRVDEPKNAQPLPGTRTSNYGFPADTPVYGLPNAVNPLQYPGSSQAARTPSVEQPGVRMSPPASQGVPEPNAPVPTPPGVAVTPPVYGSDTPMPGMIPAPQFPGPRSGMMPNPLQGAPVQGLPTIAVTGGVGRVPNMSTLPPDVPYDQTIGGQQEQFGPPVPQQPEAPDPVSRSAGWLLPYLPKWAGGIEAPSPGMPLPGSTAPIDPRGVKTQTIGIPSAPQRVAPIAAPPTGGGSVAPSTNTVKVQRYKRGPNGEPLLAP